MQEVDIRAQMFTSYVGFQRQNTTIISKAVKERRNISEYPYQPLQITREG